MKRLIKIIPLITCLSLLLPGHFAYSQTPPVSQTAGGLEKMEKDIQRRKELKERIIKEKGKEEEVVGEEGIPLEEEKRILIKKIEVTGVTLISQRTVDKIVSAYEGKELSLREMQKICDLITDEYRKKGYVTSRAYLAPQTIKEGLLIIMVVEGKLGKTQIQGNRYFKTSLLERKLKLKPGEFFDYKSLQKSLRIINEHPDREVRAVLVPGKEPGSTDLVLEVQDRLPIHAGFNYDNFGSRFIGKDRYSLSLEHNNLLGWDDKIYLRYQKSEANFYELKNFRYSIPLNSALELGFYYLWSKLKLGNEYEDADIRGKSEIGGLFLTRNLINEDNLDLRLNFGFDYKHIRNYTLGTQTSRDEVRIFKTGVDLDTLDKWGRTIFTLETDLGVPDIMGGVKAKDPYGTREGAGGKFLKFVSNIYRLQPMPFASSLLWSNQFQLSNYTLPSSEQFQIGGIANVRGYPPAEYSGDEGYATSLEWSFPPYFFSKNLKVPLSKSSFYDATRIVLFYDWAQTQLNKELAGEQKYRTLKGWGFGLRLNLPEDFSARFECAYPLDETPSDADHFHPYLNVNKRF